MYQAGHTELFKTWVVLQSNGICTWESPANIESECDIDIGSFPFDQQNCSLIFESATYGSELLVIRSMQPKDHKISISGKPGSIFDQCQQRVVKIKIWERTSNFKSRKFNVEGKSKQQMI